MAEIDIDDSLRVLGTHYSNDAKETLIRQYICAQVTGFTKDELTDYLRKDFDVAKKHFKKDEDGYKLTRKIQNAIVNEYHIR